MIVFDEVVLKKQQLEAANETNTINVKNLLDKLVHTVIAKIKIAQNDVPVFYGFT